MEIEKTEFGFKATAPLITEDEMKIINNDFDNTINKFLKMIIKDKDLAIAQYIIKRQQEQINELKTNSIPKKKVENEIEILKAQCGGNPYHIQQTLNAEIRLLQKFLNDK